ncbi:MAG: 50S ribosomal protein L32 [Bacilli bacterium]
MAVPFRKVSKTRRDMRRTHYKVTANGLVECSNCGAKIRPHRACPKCGFYKGVDTSKKVEETKVTEDVKAPKKAKTSKKSEE